MKPSAILTDGQFSALMRAVAASRTWGGRRDAFLFHFLARTGLRISEALELRVEHLYLDQDPPFVLVRTLKRRRRSGKPAPPRDHVYLDAETATRARRHVAMLYQDAGIRFAHKEPRIPLFQARPAKRGRAERPMSSRNAAAVLKTWLRRAGLPSSVSLKAFRHYRSTTLLRRTGDLEFTRSQLRHASVSTTQIYLHTDPELVRGHLEKAAHRD